MDLALDKTVFLGQYTEDIFILSCLYILAAPKKGNNFSKRLLVLV